MDKTNPKDSPPKPEAPDRRVPAEPPREERDRLPPGGERDRKGDPDAFGRMEQEGHEDEVPRDLPPVKPLKVIIIAAVLVVLLVVLFLLGYIPHRRRIAKLEAQSKRVQDAKPTVEVIHPKRTDAPIHLTLPGNAVPLQQTSLYPRANGYLKALYADIGDHVKQGQLLAEISTPEIDAQLVAAQANVQQQEANVTNAQTNYDLADATLKRYKGLFDTGGVTQQQLDEKQNAFNQAKGALDGARAAVASAQAEVQRLTALVGFEKIFAPFDGTVTARNFDVGALLNPTNTSPGQQLFDVERTDVLRVFISVPQVYATEIRTGQGAELTVRNYPRQPFHGEVARSAGALDPRTRTLRLQVNFPNPGGKLLGGMYGEVGLEVPRQTAELTIPTSAMIFNAEGTRVAVVDGQKTVHLRTITLGRDFGTEVEVADGLKGDEQIVANPGERLADDVEVQVTPAQDEGKSAQGGGRNARDAAAAPGEQKQEGSGK